MENFWTEKRIKKLKELFAKGLSTSEIGKKLGVSKNTIVGKIHRLRQANELELTRNDKEYVNDSKQQKKLFTFSFSKKLSVQNAVSNKNTDVEKSSKILIDNDRAVIENKAELIRKTSIDEADVVGSEFFKDEQAFFKDRNKDKKYQLKDLKNDMCRWAYGEPNSSNFFFCGKKTIGNKPYCLKHAKMAYIFKKNDE